MSIFHYDKSVSSLRILVHVPRSIRRRDSWQWMLEAPICSPASNLPQSTSFTHHHSSTRKKSEPLLFFRHYAGCLVIGALDDVVPAFGEFKTKQERRTSKRMTKLQYDENEKEMCTMCSCREQKKKNFLKHSFWRQRVGRRP